MLWRVIVGRLATLVVSLLAASGVIFLALNRLPGDLAQVMLGTSADPAAIAELRARLGLDRPGWERYLSWLGGLLHGDLGRSGFTNEPISSLVSGPLGVSAWLVGLGTVAALLICIPAGLWAAHRRRHADGFVVNAVSQLGMAVPAFLAGIVLVLVFAVKLRWLPANGYVHLFDDPLGWLRHLVLPVLSIGLIQGAMLTRYVRSGFIEVSTSDHIRTARSIGWGPVASLWRHGWREAALSVVTPVGLAIATGFVGAIVVEQVFVLPGLGSMLLNAVAGRDLMVVQSVIFVLVLLVLGITTVIDLCFTLLDPRLRRSRS